MFRRNQKDHRLRLLDALDDVTEPFTMFETDIGSVDQNQIGWLGECFVDCCGNTASCEHFGSVGFEKHSACFEQAIIIVDH